MTRRASASALEGVITLKVERIDALFDAFDPFPLPTRDLSHGAEEFIVGWARDLAREAPLRIVIQALNTESSDAAAISAAFANHFAYRMRSVDGDLRELFRFARLSLAIGVGVLTGCVIAARAATMMAGDANLGRILGEGLLILGWVANWRPIELMLYDWWPLRRRRDLFRRLVAARVEVRSAADTKLFADLSNLKSEQR